MKNELNQFSLHIYKDLYHQGTASDISVNDGEYLIKIALTDDDLLAITEFVKNRLSQPHYKQAIEKSTRWEEL